MLEEGWFVHVVWFVFWAVFHVCIHWFGFSFVSSFAFLHDVQTDTSQSMCSFRSVPLRLVWFSFNNKFAIFSFISKRFAFDLFAGCGAAFLVIGLTTRVTGYTGAKHVYSERVWSRRWLALLTATANNNWSLHICGEMVLLFPMSPMLAWSFLMSYYYVFLYYYLFSSFFLSCLALFCCTHRHSYSVYVLIQCVCTICTAMTMAIY